MRHYVDERQLRSASKPCRRCKSKIVGPAVALGYRGGRGNYLSDVFHPACAAEVPRPSAHELPFWDCGSLYTVKVATEPGVCPLGGTIAPGDLVLVCPCVNYGKNEPKTFLASNAQKLPDFDHENFAERRALAEQPSILHGIDRKSGSKRDLVWHLFYARALAPEEIAHIADLLGPHTTHTVELDRVLHVRFADPRSNALGVTAFIDLVAKQLDALGPVFAAHLCDRGPLRESWARVRVDAGLPPYAFPFLNHGARRSELVVAVARDPEVDELFASYGWNVAWCGNDHVRVRREGTFYEPGKMLEDLHATHPIAWAALPGEPDGDAWARWSAEQGIAEKLAALDFDAPPDEEAIAALVAKAKALAAEDDATDDPGMLVDSFHEILSQIPLERREYRAVKRMLDALLAELVD